MNAYLIIVRREGDIWIVDEDSHHVLDGGGYHTLELKVQAVRSLAPTPEEEHHVESDSRDTHD